MRGPDNRDGGMLPGTGPARGPLPPGLRMDGALLQTILAHLDAARPNEGVGLIATVTDGEYRRAVAFFPGTNVDHSPTRYTMDPAEVLSAFRVMEAAGWELGATVHSHLASPSTPSETDLAEAHYPNAILLIVGFAAGETEVRLWSMALAARPVEFSLVLDGDE